MIEKFKKLDLKRKKTIIVVGLLIICALNFVTRFIFSLATSGVISIIISLINISVYALLGLCLYKKEMKNKIHFPAYIGLALSSYDLIMFIINIIRFSSFNLLIILTSIFEIIAHILIYSYILVYYYKKKLSFKKIIIFYPLFFETLSVVGYIFYFLISGINLVSEIFTDYLLFIPLYLVILLLKNENVVEKPINKEKLRNTIITVAICLIVIISGVTNPSEPEPANPYDVANEIERSSCRSRSNTYFKCRWSIFENQCVCKLR